MTISPPSVFFSVFSQSRWGLTLKKNDEGSLLEVHPAQFEDKAKIAVSGELKDEKNTYEKSKLIRDKK